MTEGGVGGLGLLASAIAGRVVEVVDGGVGEPAWTDGVVVFVDGTAGGADLVRAVAVQASLLAQGSLGPEIVRGLGRRLRLAATTR